MKHEAWVQMTRYLRCPICQQSLTVTPEGTSLVCASEAGGKRHCFDLAKRGYVNLDTRHAGGGDEKALVSARTEFLLSGAYQPISDAVNAALASYAEAGLVLDAGCGEGYYTSRAAEALPTHTFLGVDLSKSAIDSASKQRNMTGGRASFAVAGIYDLPIVNGAASAVMNLFAPCAETEFCRVLADRGVLILVYAGEDHLYGLKKAVYDIPYKNDARADLPTGMELLTENRVRYMAHIPSGDLVRALFSMTPYAFRTSRTDLEKLNRLDSLDTEVDVTVAVYRKNG